MCSGGRWFGYAADGSGPKFGDLLVDRQRGGEKRQRNRGPRKIDISVLECKI